MQQNLLQRHAPHATALVYRPLDTGNPGQDFAYHISRLNGSPREGNASRIDVEDTILVGDSIVVRIEPDLAPTDAAQAEAKIVSVPYAERQLGSNRAAVDFVRYVRAIAGEDARARDIQTIASHYYDEVRRRAAEAQLAAETDEERDAAHATAVEDVLMEMSLWAVRLEAVTVTSDRMVGDDDDAAPEPFRFTEEQMSPSDRHALSMERAAEVLGERESTNLFQDELRHITSRKCNSHARGLVHDDEAQFQSYLRDLSDRGADEGDLEAMFESHERMVEQYDEKGVVSLHMGDGERVVVIGSLDDDVDETYLPEAAAWLAAELRALYTEGEDEETIAHWIELRLNELYGDPARDRVARTARACYVLQMPTRRRADGTCHARDAQGTRATAVDLPYTVNAYPNWEERQYVREVLEKLLDGMKRDFHPRALNSNPLYSGLVKRVRSARDTTAAIAAVQEAFRAKEEGRLSLGLFTALNTMYKLQRSRLETTPLRTRQVVRRTLVLNAPCFQSSPLFGTTVEVNEARRFVVAQPVLAHLPSLKGKDLPAFAERINALPRQERERVREAFARTRSDLYARAADGLLEAIGRDSHAKRMYLRFAFYEDRRSGKCNVPNHVIHTLRAEDKARAWELLKSLSGVAVPVAA